jgi:hypothetical protein
MEPITGERKMSIDCNVHILANGAKLVSLSPHGFKFSDGTESVPQRREFCDQFNLQKEFIILRNLKGMSLTKTSFVVTSEQYGLLHEIASKVDIVLVPFQFLQALHDSFGIDLAIDNVVSFNSTKETSRSSPTDKIVDINNWSVID